SRAGRDHTRCSGNSLAAKRGYAPLDSRHGDCTGQSCVQLSGGSMLSWAIGFFIVAILAAIFGFTGLAGTAAGIAKVLFFLFLIAFIVSLVMGYRGPRGGGGPGTPPLV